MPSKPAPPLPRILVLATDLPHTFDSTLSALEPLFSQADLTVVDSAHLGDLLSPEANTRPSPDWVNAIDWLRQGQFHTAIILTPAGQSPYTLGYLCYLAGIPNRIGQSQEFGGQVLSHCLSPPGVDGF